MTRKTGNKKHELDSSDKIIVACTGIVAMAAFWMRQERHHYSKDVKRIAAHLKNIRDMVIVSNQSIKDGNAELEYGNEMLREVVGKMSVEDGDNKK